MADEEKPTAEELAAQESAEFTDATAAPSDGQDPADDAEEAVEAIAKNVQERAAEIEDVLADASTPAALVKEESAESADALPAVEQLMGSFLLSQTTAVIYHERGGLCCD